MLATFATPYGFRLLPDFLKSQYSEVGFVHFSELTSMGFRRPQDYVVMLLVMFAFIADRDKRIADLERQLAARKRNSTNSSKPPSSDLNPAYSVA